MSSTCLGTLGWSYVAETGSGRLRAITAGVSAAGGVAIGTLFSTTVPYMVCFIQFFTHTLASRVLTIYF